MKKILIIVVMMVSAISLVARPKPNRIHRPGPVHRPVHHHHTPKHVHHSHRHHHHHSIVPIVAGAITGYVIGKTITQPAPVVVTQPIVVRPTETVIWEEGHYEDQVQANGTIIRVWVPGRYIKKIITP